MKIKYKRETDVGEKTFELDKIHDWKLKCIQDKLKSRIIKEFEKYKCDFNWNMKTNKQKHTSYIALSDVIKIVKKA